jgi:hypothetical protein
MVFICHLFLESDKCKDLWVVFKETVPFICLAYVSMLIIKLQLVASQAISEVVF